MIKINYDYSDIKCEDLKKYEDEIASIVSNFKSGNCEGKEYIGWYEYPSNVGEEELKNIEEEAENIRKNSEVFVVCGIGGSYLGARAVIEAIKGTNREGIEIVYLGNTFDERYTQDVLDYLENKDFSVNVISKSGSTLETALAFRLLKKLLIKKYGNYAKERIYVTTDADNGSLRKIVNEEGYTSYSIPSNIGGRYSVFTPVGLLPLAVAGVDIKEFINGAKKAFCDLQEVKFKKNVAYQYAAYRYLEYQKGKKVELFVTYSPYLNMLCEWLKQLFGESEGKEEKGLLPASACFSTDLHSLGQFVQQGSKILFITQFKILDQGKLKIERELENYDNLNYLEKETLAQINLKAQEGTNKAHFEIGRVNDVSFEMDKVSEFNIGYIMYLFMYSCTISSYLLGVNPFNQPGVEHYKSEMEKLLKK